MKKLSAVSKNDNKLTVLDEILLPEIEQENLEEFDIEVEVLEWY